MGAQLLRKLVQLYYVGNISRGLDNCIMEIAEDFSLIWIGQGISTVEPIERNISFYYDGGKINEFITKVRETLGSWIRINVKENTAAPDCQVAH